MLPNRAPIKRPHVVVVIARYVDDPRAFLALLSNTRNTSVWLVGQKKLLPQALEIDDVADEVQRVAAGLPQEIEQELYAARARPQVNVGKPDRFECRVHRQALAFDVGRTA